MKIGQRLGFIIDTSRTQFHVRPTIAEPQRSNSKPLHEDWEDPPVFRILVSVV